MVKKEGENPSDFVIKNSLAYANSYKVLDLKTVKNKDIVVN